MKIEIIKIDDLKPYFKNAKMHPEKQINEIAESIKKFGMNNPIGIWNNEIVYGHGRVIALKRLGYTEAHCIRLDHLTDIERRAYILADNQTSLASGFDEKLLNEELKELEESLDMTIFGFKFENELVDEEFDLKEILEPTCKLGDIWKLGEHRLMCGDSTDVENVKRLMNGDVADLIITDPPYNVNYEDKQAMLFSYDKLMRGSGSSRFRKGELVSIRNDKLTDCDFAKFLNLAYSVMNDNLKKGGALYIFHAGKESVNFIINAKKYFKFYQTLIWVKHHHILSRSDYHYKHEPILYLYKEGGKKYFTDDRTQSTVFEDVKLEYIKKMTKNEIVKFCEELYLNMDNVKTTVLYENKPEKNEYHPTIKPIKLLATLIRNSSRKNEIVLDIFGGSGSTLLACEQLNRKCYISEIDPKYCDVIIKRFEQLTNLKAIKL